MYRMKSVKTQGATITDPTLSSAAAKNTRQEEKKHG